MYDSTPPISQTAVTVSIRLKGSSLPVDHQYDLGEEVLRLVPALKADPFAGVHPIKVAASQNGWSRPDGLSQTALYMSKRTRLVIRTSPLSLPALTMLCDQELRLGEHTIQLGASTVKPIVASTTLFVRNIRFPSSAQAATEDQRRSLILDEARALGVTELNLIFGSESHVNHKQAGVRTYNLLIADLTGADSLILQERGLGIDPVFGCGLPIPYKSIAAVGT